MVTEGVALCSVLVGLVRADLKSGESLAIAVGNLRVQFVQIAQLPDVSVRFVEHEFRDIEIHGSPVGESRQEGNPESVAKCIK
jgi:hypothetical protein